MLCFPALTSDANAQSLHDSKKPCIDNYSKAIGILAADSMEGRAAGSIGESKAASYIIDFLSERVDIQVSTLPFTVASGNDSVHSLNVLGHLDNLADSTVIIMAHFDHIGQGGELSRSPLSRAIHPGADDNASGVGLMLSLATCKSLPSNWNYLFAAVSGHEIGLHGSRFLVRHLAQILTPIALVVNLDMIGRMDRDKNLYIETNTDAMRPLFDKAAMKSDIAVKVPPRPRLFQLDSKWFAEAGIPTATFTTGLHLDYHKPSDTFEHLNLQGIDRIQGFMVQFLQLLSENE